MPGSKEDLLSLLSIEILISHVQIELHIECHLPCVVFRLLDYPAVSIPYFDQWQVEEFHSLKRDHPEISWRQLLSDQFYELRSANGKLKFNRGKSCLFKTYFKSLYAHLLNVPLFLLLIDQIHDQNASTSHFIGSCNVKLNELIEILNQSIIRNGNDVPLVEQQTFHCTLFNLMGTNIGTCDVAIRFCHYGTTILTHLPMLDDRLITKMDQKAPAVAKIQAIERSPQPSSTDTVIKHIHFVNEKKDVGLQLSRHDLPSSSSNNKSAQTRWTSTKTRSTEHYHRSLRTSEDSAHDDPTIASYRPPPLYFNSNCEFLQMITPATTKVVEAARENRLSYLASIPIASFDTQSTEKEDADDEKSQPKRKSISTVRFHLPSSVTTAVSRTKVLPKQPTLAKDFLHHFPLLRSLVEEALALQQHQYDVPVLTRPVMFDERPYSAVQNKQQMIRQTPLRPKSAGSACSVRSRSVIVTRNTNNARRLYPPVPKTNQMIITKDEVRHLVDRLSKPRFNKRVERELTLVNQDASIREPVIIKPRTRSKPTSASSNRTVSKPSLSYGITRAHRLMVNFSRARCAAMEPQAISSPQFQTPPKKEIIAVNRISSSPKTNTISPLSLLNNVDVDSATVEKNTTRRLSSGITPEKIGPTIKSESTTSEDVTLQLNQTITKTMSSTPIPVIHPHNEEKDDLNFSISDITDYFTDGDGSSTHPPT